MISFIAYNPASDDRFPGLSDYNSHDLFELNNFLV